MKIWTDAPIDYDGFGTKTIAIVAMISHWAGNRPVRLVETPDKHVTWQRKRYDSGLYLNAVESELPRVKALLLPLEGTEPPVK